MEIQQDVRDTHRNLSPLALGFLDYVQEDPARARRPEDPNAGLPSWVLRYTYPMQAWPTFVGAAKLAEIERATVGVTHLIKAVPQRIFGNDPRRVAAYYRLPSQMLAFLILEPPNAIAGALARCDFIDGPEGLRCLEVNVAGNIGGWHLRFLERKYRESPVVARFLAERGVRAVARDPWRVLLSHVVEDTLASPVAVDGVLNLGLAVSPGELEPVAGATGYLDETYAEVLAAHGLTGKILIAAYPGGFAAARGMLLHGGATRVHAVVEYTDEPTPQEVYRCFKAETVTLYNGPVSRLLWDKRNLALLSEHAESDRFTAEERALIAEHVPWSREVAPGETTYEGEKASLLPLLAGRRESFVLKRASGFRGEEVLVGRHTAPEEWERAVAAAAAEGMWLAQERVASRPHLGQHGEAGALPHDVVWGTFCFGDRYGGGFLRMVPRGSGDGIINVARGATMGLIFEV